MDDGSGVATGVSENWLVAVNSWASETDSVSVTVRLASPSGKVALTVG